MPPTPLAIRRAEPRDAAARLGLHAVDHRARRAPAVWDAGARKPKAAS